MDKKPIISIVIPSRNRPDVLRTSLKLLLQQQPDNNVEILVSENSDHDRHINHLEFGDRVRFIRPPTVLNMTEHWTFALKNATGGHLMFLSDKDILLPGSVATLLSCVREFSPGILTFFRNIYLPDNRVLCAQPGDGTIELRSLENLSNLWFESLDYFPHVPMIYNSVVRRDVIERCEAKYREIFAGGCPDVSSSVLLCQVESSYYFLNRPILLSNSGAWSTGLSLHGITGPEASKSFSADFRENPFVKKKILLNVAGAIAETLLECSQLTNQKISATGWENYIRSSIRKVRKERSAGSLSRALYYLSAGAVKHYNWGTLLRAVATELRHPGEEPASLSDFRTRHARYYYQNIQLFPAGDINEAFQHPANLPTSNTGERLQ